MNFVLVLFFFLVLLTLAVRTSFSSNRGLRNGLRPIATSDILDTKIDPFLQKNSLVMGCSGCSLISLRNGTKLHEKLC